MHDPGPEAEDIAARLGISKETVYVRIAGNHMTVNAVGRLSKFQPSEVEWVLGGGASALGTET